MFIPETKALSFRKNTNPMVMLKNILKSILLYQLVSKRVVLVLELWQNFIEVVQVQKGERSLNWIQIPTVCEKTTTFARSLPEASHRTKSSWMPQQSHFFLTYKGSGESSIYQNQVTYDALLVL